MQQIAMILPSKSVWMAGKMDVRIKKMTVWKDALRRMMENDLLMTISKYPIRAYKAYAPIVSSKLATGCTKKQTTQMATEAKMAVVNVS